MSHDIDAKIFHAEVNEKIDEHLKLWGVMGIEGLRDSIMAQAVAGLFLPTLCEPLEDYGHDDFELYIEHSERLHFLCLEDLILVRAIILKMSPFDLYAIIKELEVDTHHLIHAFDGLDAFSHVMTDGRQIDPLMISIGVVQGLSVDLDARREFSKGAHESYIGLNAFVGAGVARNFINNKLDLPSCASGVTKLEMADVISGSLTYINSLDHMPNRSVHQYLAMSGALHPFIVTRKVPTENSWDQVFTQANGDFKESPLSKQIMETLFSPSFLAVHEKAAVSIIHNIHEMAAVEFDEAAGSYKQLLASAEGSSIAHLFDRLSVKLNFLSQEVLQTMHAQGEIHPEFSLLVQEILCEGDQLLSKVLNESLDIPDEMLGTSTFCLPRLVHVAVGETEQIVDPKIAAAYINHTINAFDQWFKEHAKIDNDGYDMRKATDAYRYVLSFPGVQDLIGAQFSDYSDSVQNHLLRFGIDASKIKSPSGRMLDKAFSRDLGI